MIKYQMIKMKYQMIKIIRCTKRPEHFDVGYKCDILEDINKAYKRAEFWNDETCGCIWGVIEYEV